MTISTSTTLFNSTDASALFLSLGIFWLFLFFKTYSMVKWASNIHYCAAPFYFFMSTTTMSGLLCSIVWSVWIGKSHSTSHSSDSYTGFGSWSCQFREQSKPNFWRSLELTHLPTWSSLQPLYSFWANLSHSVTMCLMVSSCSRHILHNGDISSPSILFIILLVHNAWSWAAVMRPSVSFFKTPFPSQSQVSAFDLV